MKASTRQSHQNRRDRARKNVGTDLMVGIRALLPSLSPTEQRVATVVVNDPAKVANGTISDLAARCSTSETTVVRFCRAVGFAGYSDFRVALAITVGHADARYGPVRVGRDIGPGDDTADIIAKIVSADARAIEDTGSQLNPVTLEQVAAKVANARQIDLYGVGASAVVALDLQQKLHRIGHVVFTWLDPNVAITSASLRQPGDVAIAISHTGATLDSIECLREAQRRGATTVAITNFPRSPVTKFADLVLTTATRETTFRSGAMTSRIAALTVVDCLFVAVAQRERDTVNKALERTRDAVAPRRTSNRSSSPRRRRLVKDAGTQASPSPRPGEKSTVAPASYGTERLTTPTGRAQKARGA